MCIICDLGYKFHFRNQVLNQCHRWNHDIKHLCFRWWVTNFKCKKTSPLKESFSRGTLFLVSWGSLPSVLERRTATQSTITLPQKEPMIRGQQRSETSFKYKLSGRAASLSEIRFWKQSCFLAFSSYGQRLVVESVWVLCRSCSLPNQRTPLPFLGSKAKIRFHLQRRQNLQSTIWGHGSTPLQERASKLKAEKRWTLWIVSANYTDSFLSLYLTSLQLCPSSHLPCPSPSPQLQNKGKGSSCFQLFVQSARVRINLVRSPLFHSVSLSSSPQSHTVLDESQLVQLCPVPAAQGTRRNWEQLRQTAELERERGRRLGGGWGGGGGEVRWETGWEWA